MHVEISSYESFFQVGEKTEKSFFFFGEININTNFDVNI